MHKSFQIKSLFNHKSYEEPTKSTTFSPQCTELTHLRWQACITHLHTYTNVFIYMCAKNMKINSIKYWLVSSWLLPFARTHTYSACTHIALAKKWSNNA